MPPKRAAAVKKQTPDDTTKHTQVEEVVDFENPSATKNTETATKTVSASKPTPQPTVQPPTSTTTKPSTSSPPKPEPGPIPALTDKQIEEEIERRRARAKRFGVEPGDEADQIKKLERLKRFGSDAYANAGGKKRVIDDPVEAEKASKRAEKFGTGSTTVKT